MIIIKTAIVENEDNCIQQLKNALEDWKQNLNYECEIHINEFKSGADFLITNIDEYHIVFLDIELEGLMNGVIAAQRMRKEGFPGSIVFITEYQQYVFSGYQVEAADFIIKPIDYKKIDWCMKRIFDKMSQGSFVCSARDEIRKIPYNQILYFQSALHYIDIITGEKRYHAKLSFKQLKKILPSQFVQCHRTLIVNLWKIDYINKKDIFLINGEDLPISDSCLEDVRKAYIRHNM